MARDEDDAARAAEDEEQRQAVERRRSTPPPRLGEFRSLRRRSTVVRAILAAIILANVVGGLFEAIHLTLLGGITSYEWHTSDSVTTSGDRLAAIYVFQILLYIGAAVAFISWLFRAHHNVVPLGAERYRFGPGWAIGGWFVPILNLWRPKQIVNDAWRATEAPVGTDPNGSEWEQIRPWGLLTWWWALWLLSTFVGRLGGWSEAETLADDERLTTIALAVSVIDVAAAILAVRVVERITERQEARTRELGTLPDPAA